MMPATFRPSFQLPIPYNGSFSKRVQGYSAEICENLEKAAAVEFETRIVSRREPADGVVVVGMQAPALAAAVRPAQFVMAIPPAGAVAAVALGIYDVSSEVVSLLFFVAGRRTRDLASLRIGDALCVLGPLGNGFDLAAPPKDVAIVAGGIGIASVLLAARELARAGSRVRLFYGARTASRLVEYERFAEIGCELSLATEDGSAGERGFVTQALARAPLPELVLACGPTPMLRATAQFANRANVPAQLALEETFACGVGGCWGCVVPLSQSSSQAPHFPATDEGIVNARVCREGPVFLASELRW